MSKREDQPYSYWKFMNSLLNVFGKRTPLVFAAFLFVVSFWLIASLYLQFSAPVANHTEGASQDRYAVEMETGVVSTEPTLALKKQRFLASYEDSIPGNNTEWLDWAWVSAKNVCVSLDDGESLLAIRSKFPQDQYYNNMKLISKDAILIVCPKHMSQLQLPANAETVAP
jgi:hypothetical protein